jgi:predicted nucleic acid-binding Zn finger protein
VLQNWDFSDTAANSTTPQVNRQKSARHLGVISIDRQNRTGVFLDPRKGIKNEASLAKCDCIDFNFAGNSPRKTFKPCMHIYRLAMELGLLEPKYEDRRSKEIHIAQDKQAETELLQTIPRDPNAWGRWNSAIHVAGTQRERQERGLWYGSGPDAGRKEKEGWIISDYYVTLESCECPDFAARRLPCKHIYAAARLSGIAL